VLPDADALARPSLNASVVGHADSGLGGPGSIVVSRHQVVRLRPGATHRKGDEARCLSAVSMNCARTANLTQ
jgi:hypothetical protein